MDTVYLLDNIYKYKKNNIYNLGEYCKSIGDYENMIKYYQMAINMGDVQATIELEKYYKKSNNNIV